MAAGETLVKGRILPAIKLVDGQLPDGLTPGRTFVTVAMALVRHSKKR